MALALAQFPWKSRSIFVLTIVSAAVALEAPACAPPGPAAGLPAPTSCDTTEVRAGCPCPKPLEAVAGGCADHAVLLATCGPHPAGSDTCVVACGTGEALDPTKGTCLSSKEVGDLPEAAWLGLHDGERLTCPTGTLEVGTGKIGCRPANLCRFNQTWDGKACQTPAPCPAGTFRDGPTCRPFVGPSGVDLALWGDKILRPAVCPLLPLDTSPVIFHIAIDAPGNDLAHLSTSVESTSVDIATVRKTLESYADALRSLQGAGTATKTELTVTCPGQTLSAPKIQEKP